MIKILLTLFTLLIPIISFANKLKNENFYLNLGIGYGYVSKGSNYNPTNTWATSYSINSGYDINRLVGIEIGFNALPNVYIYNTTNNIYIADAVLRINIPINNFSKIFCEGGFSQTQISNNNDFYTNSGFFMALGIFFKINNKISIQIEDFGSYIPNNTNNNVNVISLNIGYHF